MPNEQTMPDYQTITLERRGSVAVMTINRPDKLNALNQQVHIEGVAALDELRADDSVRVVINELQLEQAIHVKEVKLPENVKALDDPDAVIVHVLKKGAEPEPTAEAATTAEPEVITRKKAEEEG